MAHLLAIAAQQSFRIEQSGTAVEAEVDVSRVERDIDFQLAALPAAAIAKGAMVDDLVCIWHRTTHNIPKSASQSQHLRAATCGQVSQEYLWRDVKHAVNLTRTELLR